MILEQALAILRQARPELIRRGVARAAVFGSVARDEGTPASDIDVLLEFDPSSDLGVYEYVALTRFLHEQFLAPVDVVNRAALKPHVRASAEADLRYAF